MRRLTVQYTVVCYKHGKQCVKLWGHSKVSRETVLHDKCVCGLMRRILWVLSVAKNILLWLPTFPHPSMSLWVQEASPGSKASQRRTAIQMLTGKIPSNTDAWLFIQYIFSHCWDTWKQQLNDISHQSSLNILANGLEYNSLNKFCVKIVIFLLVAWNYYSIPKTGINILQKKKTDETSENCLSTL